MATTAITTKTFHSVCVLYYSDDWQDTEVLLEGPFLRSTEKAAQAKVLELKRVQIEGSGWLDDYEGIYFEHKPEEITDEWIDKYWDILNKGQYVSERVTFHLSVVTADG